MRIIGIVVVALIAAVAVPQSGTGAQDPHASYEQGERDDEARTDHYGSSGSMTTVGDCMMVSAPGVDFSSSGC